MRTTQINKEIGISSRSPQLTPTKHSVMKIFISWSGKRSHEVAKLVDYWIKCVIQAVDPWISSKDMDRGSVWFREINDQLQETHNGIICLTKENLNSPWILFESGALAKGLSSNRVYTFLVDLEPINIKDPLAQFNHTLPNKEDMLKLVTSINYTLRDKKLSSEILNSVFETYWPQFEKRFKEIIDNTPETEIEPKMSENDLLGEILNSVRGMDRRLRHIESDTSTADNNGQYQTYRNLQPVISIKELKAAVKELVSIGINDEEIFATLKNKAPKSMILKMIQKARLDEGMSSAFL